MKLYIVATPIGNLQDITLRALAALKEADLILCEDTRHTLKLLNHFEIKKPLLSYHQHSQLQKIEQIIQLLQEGKTLALVSDAGTPGVCDPGNKLIETILEKLPEAQIIPIPGSSALAALLSVAGIEIDRFLFLGFLPIKKHRQDFLRQIIESPYPVVFYESPYKILKTLKEIEKLEPDLKTVIAKELTKMFEKIYRGGLKEVIEQIEKDKPRGEYAVVIF
ncbi:MAG: 16S rRNA (cytidine(1402)-2'-O)-methyltransferase [Candidatus Pacebacteria bacterium]|nr:16S rRNA (cytidine(1402)-2'-O)-methyltransferase [Candidatus Paceibacterota bacterium]